MGQSPAGAQRTRRQDGGAAPRPPRGAVPAPARALRASGPPHAPWALLAGPACPAVNKSDACYARNVTAPGASAEQGLFFIKKQNLNQENKVIKFLLGTAGPVETGLMGLTGTSALDLRAGVPPASDTDRRRPVPPNVRVGLGCPGLGSKKVGMKPSGLSRNCQAGPRARGARDVSGGRGPQMWPARYCGGLAASRGLPRPTPD